MQPAPPNIKCKSHIDTYHPIKYSEKTHLSHEVKQTTAQRHETCVRTHLSNHQGHTLV